MALRNNQLDSWGDANDDHDDPPMPTAASVAAPDCLDPSAALADDAPAGRDANALALLLAAVSLVLLAAGALAWRLRLPKQSNYPGDKQAP